MSRPDTSDAAPATHAAPARSTSAEPDAPPSGSAYSPPTWLLVAWWLVIGVGTAALCLCAFDVGPGWLSGAASVAVVTGLSWLLASRTAGRAFVSALVALGLGTTAVLVGGEVLLSGASLLTCAVGGVYAVMATIPAVTFGRAVRETLIASAISVITALAAVGFEPTVSVERYDIASVLIALVLAVAIVYRLGAGLHGLGRRGLIAVAFALGVMVATVAYAELLRRYGSQDMITTVLDFVEATRERIIAFPRPLVALLGIPALVWGTHLRARRRQGWWVCTFGVAATVPMAAGLVAADSSYLEATLRAAYSLLLGLPLGYLVIRADLALTGSRGAGARRAEEAEALRPEPSRFAEL